MTRMVILLFLVSPLVLSACMVGPDYQGPPAQEGSQWPAGEPEARHARPGRIDVRWWENFDDPVLDDLLAKVARNNLSIRIATARIDQARGLLDSARSGLFPAVEADFSYDRMRRSANSEFGRFPGIDLNRENWQTGFDAGWELDLFGRVRHQLQAGKAMLDSSV